MTLLAVDLEQRQAALDAWVGHAQPGERADYYEGFLAIDAGLTDVTPLAKLRNRVNALCAQGTVLVTQSPLGGGKWRYTVVRRGA